MKKGSTKGNLLDQRKSAEFYLFLRRYGIVLVMLAIMLVLTIVSPTFRKLDNFIAVLTQVSLNGVLALGMVFVITTGGIDLSMGSMLALTSAVIGVVVSAKEGSIFFGLNDNPALSFVVAVVLSILATTSFGFLNGILISKFSMFPFVVTLSTQLVIRGAAYLISDGKSKSLSNQYVKTIATKSLFGKIPYPVVIMAVLLVLGYLLLHWTKFGRYVYAVGGNENAAVASGVNVMKTKTKAYIISGFCAGVAGVIMTSRIGASQPNIGTGYETDAIAACVIGGTSIVGGISTIPGTFVGIIIIGLIENGMNLIGIKPHWQIVTKGLLIIGAVMLDKVLSKRR